MSDHHVDISKAAQALHEWSFSVVDLVDKGLFGIAPEGSHREAMILDVLSRNAREVKTASLDATGGLYSPFAFLLAAICKRLDLLLTGSHWQAALTNVLMLRKQLIDYREVAGSFGLDLGTSTSVFKDALDEALGNSGFAGVDSDLDEENRRIALGLALNWGMRFLLAYAVECGENLPEPSPKQKDLSWIRDLISPLLDPNS